MKPVEMKKDGNGVPVMPITQHLFGMMKHKDWPKLEVGSVLNEIVPRFVSEGDWDALPKVRNTVVEYDVNDQPRDASEPTFKRCVRLVQFLVMPVYEEEPNAAHFEKFGGTIRRLMRSAIPKGVLAPPFFMQLVGAEGRPKGVLCAYFAVDLSQDDLNKILGFYGFVKEGEVPTVEWP